MLDGRQRLPDDYWREFARAPYIGHSPPPFPPLHLALSTASATACAPPGRNCIWPFDQLPRRLEFPTGSRILTVASPAIMVKFWPFRSKLYRIMVRLWSNTAAAGQGAYARPPIPCTPEEPAPPKSAGQACTLLGACPPEIGRPSVYAPWSLRPRNRPGPIPGAAFGAGSAGRASESAPIEPDSRRPRDGPGRAGRMAGRAGARESDSVQARRVGRSASARPPFLGEPGGEAMDGQTLMLVKIISGQNH